MRRDAFSIWNAAAVHPAAGGFVSRTDGESEMWLLLHAVTGLARARWTSCAAAPRRARDNFPPALFLSTPPMIVLGLAHLQLEHGGGWEECKAHALPLSRPALCLLQPGLLLLVSAASARLQNHDAGVCDPTPEYRPLHPDQ